MFKNDSDEFDPRPFLWLLAFVSVTLVVLRLLRRRRGLFDRIRPNAPGVEPAASVADFPPYAYRREAVDSEMVPQPPPAQASSLPAEIELPHIEPALEPTAEPIIGKVDDIKIIEGIGPRYEQILAEAGITTFDQLAETPVERLREILGERRLRLTDPATWPEQAALAARGEWEALQALQNSLRAGRRPL